MAENDPKNPPCDAGDELQVGPEVGPGSRLFVRHTADHERVMGVMRPVREGEPLLGGVFQLSPKDPANGVYHVKDVPIPQPGAPTKPAKVNSREFLDGWERTFGGRQPVVGQA